MINDSPHGQGTMTYTDGRKYVGGWKDGKPNGQGTLTYPNGVKYGGDWKDGKKHGQGTMILLNGTNYVGEFFNGKALNGEIYDNSGNIIARYVNGEMVQISKKGVLFERKRNVNGKWGWYDNEDIGIGPSRGKYVGEIENGLPNGQGTQISNAGFNYEGDWKDGERHGTGKITFSNGEIYQGEFKYHKRHGKGVYTYPDGRYMIGEWLGGKKWNTKGYDNNGNLEVEVKSGRWISN
jgi:hypothetical protein